MKIEVTIKDPDGIYDSVMEAVKNEVNALESLDDEEKESLIESRMGKVWGKLEKWIEYKEYIKIEFDTDAGTAEVMEN